MKRLSTVLAAACALLLSAGAATAADSPEHKRYLVAFEADQTGAQQQRALESIGATIVERYDELGVVLVEAPEPGATAGVLAADSMFGIKEVQEDLYWPNWLVGSPIAGPSMQGTPLPRWDELRERLPAFERAAAPDPRQLPPGVGKNEIPWGIARVAAPWAWSSSEGAGVRVAVIDTGVDTKHPDLVAAIAGGRNFVDADKPYDDDNGHGTHVAGTIAAARDGRGVAGVAPKARIYGVKVLDKDGGGRISSIIKGIVWCANNDIQVANMSLGAPIGSVFMRLAVKYAKSKGVTIIAAAGNSGGSVGCPACYEETIAVSALDSQDQLADFSSRGKAVDLAGPGVDVLSSVPGGGYDSYSGTSMATPHVAGLAALAVSRGASGPDAVRRALLRAARPVAGLGRDEQGAGVVDAEALMR